MKVTVDGRDYRLPGGLNELQRRLYIHLIDWKRAHVGDEPGIHADRGRQIAYNAILPSALIEDLPIIYRPIVNKLRHHRNGNGVRLHTQFQHLDEKNADEVKVVWAERRGISTRA